MTGILKSSSDSYALMDTESGSLSNISHDSRLVSTKSRFDVLPSNSAALKKIILILFVLVIFLLLILFIVSLIFAFSNNSNPSEIKGSEKNGESQNSHSAQSAQTQLEPTSSTIYSSTTPRTIYEASLSSSPELSVTTVNGKNVQPGAHIFYEEFDNFNFDSSENIINTTWKHTIGISESKFHFAVNSRSNSFVRDGKLFLKATYTSDKYGEEFIYNGTLFFGVTPNKECQSVDKSTPNHFCWKSGHEDNIIHPVMSALITTERSFSFKYGIVEIKAKMPSGDWLEPMISLQPKSYFYGKSGLLSGQMHLVDIRGNRKLFNMNGLNVGSERNCPDIRYGTMLREKAIFSCKNTLQDEGFDREFHLYTVEWTPGKIIVKIDDEVIVNAPSNYSSLYEEWVEESGTYPNPWWNSKDKTVAPFDQEFSFLIGLAAGGTSGFFPDVYTGPYPKPWSNNDPKAAKNFWEKRHLWEPSWDDDGSALQIDYIRVRALDTTV